VRRLAVAAALATACGAAQPGPANVTLPLPVSPAPSDPPSGAPVHSLLPPSDASDFTSDRGPVHLATDADGSIVGSFQSDGVLVCSAGAAVSCEWLQGNDAGHAAFRRRSGGGYEGTWGRGASDSDGGAWNLVPVPRAGEGLNGPWSTNWGAATILEAHGKVHVHYKLGTMDCTRLPGGRTLTCTWTEDSQSGAAVFDVESPRVLRGTWGNGPSATDGGKWVFVRR
jgi:hypothetical protein